MIRPLRVIALLLAVGLIVQACGGDDTSSIRVELSALQTQVAISPTAAPTSIAPTTPEPTPTSTESPTPVPTATAVPTAPKPVVQATPVPTAPKPVVQATAAPTTSACDTDTLRYAADVTYLNGLQVQLVRKGLLDPGEVWTYFTSIPCITPCDRQWLSNAVVVAERLLRTGVRASYSPAIPSNDCQGGIIGN